VSYFGRSVGGVLIALSEATDSVGGYTTVYDAWPVWCQICGYVSGRRALAGTLHSSRWG